MPIYDDDPRKVGGRYYCGYWRENYEVLAFVDHHDWRGRSIQIRWGKDGRIVEHSTGWEPRTGDRIISEPQVSA